MLKAGFSVILSAALVLTSLPASAADAIRIGYISTLSSPTSTAGPDMLESFKLGLAEFGGKLAGREVQLIVNDDQMKPDVGVQVARKMLDENKVQLITGIVLSNVMLAVARTVLPRKVVILSLNAGPSPLAGTECNQNFFAASYQSDTVAEGAGIYLQKTGVKSVSLMAPNYVAGRDIMTGFKRYYKGTIATETYTPLDQFDFAAELAEIRAANPAATFYFYTSGAPSTNFVKQYAEAGLKGKIPLYGVAMALDELTLPGMGEAAYGIKDSTFWTADMKIPASQAFVAHFEATYHHRPSIFAALAYDGVRMLEAALRTVHGDIENSEAFRNALMSAKFDSVRGHFKFNTNHFPIQDLHLARVEKDASGKPVNDYDELIERDHQDAYAAQCKMP